MYKNQLTNIREKYLPEPSILLKYLSIDYSKK
jgi:hypothetical protein